MRYSRTGAQTPVWVTAQALTALAQKPFPVAPVRRGASPAAVHGATGATATAAAHARSRHAAARSARGGGSLLSGALVKPQPRWPRVGDGRVAWHVLAPVLR